jgi:hypothetical protein
MTVSQDHLEHDEHRVVDVDGNAEQLPVRVTRDAPERYLIIAAQYCPESVTVRERFASPDPVDDRGDDAVGGLDRWARDKQLCISSDSRSPMVCAKGGAFRAPSQVRS